MKMDVSSLKCPICEGDGEEKGEEELLKTWNSVTGKNVPEKRLSKAKSFTGFNSSSRAIRYTDTYHS